MTYRSSTNPFDKTNYSNFAFKKSEILNVLRILNSTFSFEITNSYKDIFFKYDLFNMFEVACLISGYDPNILRIDTTRNINWQNKNPKFVEALNLVMSSDKGQNNGFWNQVDSNCYECEYVIKNQDLKIYLASKNIIIKNFNDNIPIPQSVGQNQIQQESERLRMELIQAQEIIEQLKTKIEIEQAEIQTRTSESKLHPRAENNVAKLILVLAKQANIDLSTPYGQYDALKTQAELLGLDTFPSEETIAKWIKKAQEQSPN